MTGLRRHWIYGLLLSVIAVTLVGCQSAAPYATSADAAAGSKRVLTTFTVIADMAGEVAGDKLVVESITKIGTEIHDYEPTPSDIVRAQDADLVLNNGMGLERWFEKFMGALEGVPSVNVSSGIEPIPIAEGSYKDKPNPHAWMSLKNARVYVENIRAAFVELDPENAATYNANAAAYLERFAPLEAKLEQTLQRDPRTTAGAGVVRRRVQLFRPRRRSARSLPVADQCRPGRHPRPDALGDPSDQGQRYSGGVL